MGYSISWYAFSASAAEAVFASLGLSKTGTEQDSPESMICAAGMKTGWKVLWYDRYDCPFLKEDDLSRLSESCDIVCCRVEEHVMASSSEFWRKGEILWAISHEGENGPVGFDFAGQLPDSLAEIRKEMEALQEAAGGLDAGVDYIFEIPLRVAQRLVGFKHDTDPGDQQLGRFEVYERVASRGGLLSRIFKAKGGSA